MIEKNDFYHGVVFKQILDAFDTVNIEEREGGYLLNSSVYMYIKYTTKSRSPWGFVFNDEELAKLTRFSKDYNVALSFVCAHDGICCITYEAFRMLMPIEGGWLSVSRKFSGMYSVSGPIGELDRKVALNLKVSLNTILSRNETEESR